MHPTKHMLADLGFQKTSDLRRCTGKAKGTGTQPCAIGRELHNIHIGFIKPNPARPKSSEPSQQAHTGPKGATGCEKAFRPCRKGTCVKLNTLSTMPSVLAQKSRAATEVFHCPGRGSSDDPCLAPCTTLARACARTAFQNPKTHPCASLNAQRRILSQEAGAVPGPLNLAVAVSMHTCAANSCVCIRPKETRLPLKAQRVTGMP